MACCGIKEMALLLLPISLVLADVYPSANSVAPPSPMLINANANAAQASGSIIPLQNLTAPSYPSYDNSHAASVFKVYLNREFAEDDLIKYTGVIGIGTPAKQLKFIFDTDSQDTWVLYKMWTQLRTRGYSKDDSKSGKKIGGSEHKSVYYKSTSTLFEGSQYSDLLKLYQESYDGEQGATLIVNFPQEFMGVKDIKKSGSSKNEYKLGSEDGSIGLAPALKTTLGLSPFIQAFKSYQDSRHVQCELKFGLWFNPTLLSSKGGELDLGGVNQAKFKGQIFYHNINSAIRWQLPLQNVKINGMTVSCKSGCNAVLDSGSHFLFAPKRDIEQIYDKLGVRYSSGKAPIYIDCKELPSIEFIIDNVTYQITSLHYRNTRVSNGQMKSECYIGIKEHKSEDWILGTNFLSAYYTVFDVQNKRIGFASPTS